MESRKRQSNKRATRKHGGKRSVSKRVVAKRGVSKRSIPKRGGGCGCGVYKGGAMNVPVPAPGPAPIGSRYRLACAALDARIGQDEATRATIKRYLQTLYGSSETWKLLRRPPPGGLQNANFDALPEDLKTLVQNLLDIVLEIYETGNEATQMLTIIHLINYNLYYLTRNEVDEGDNDGSDMSSNYESSNNESEEEQNDPSAGSPRSTGSRGSRGTHSSNSGNIGSP